MKIARPVVSVLALSALCVCVAQAQNEPRPPRPAIRTTGEATVTAKPDRVIIDVGVVTQATTAQAAAQQNAARLDAVMRQLKAAAGAGAELKTISYSVDPQYRYPKPGGEPVIAGYMARNTVEVTTGDLNAAGAIIDAATQTGANNIERLQFTLKDDQAAHAQALREATVKARAKAEAIAASLGVKIAGVLLVEEGAAEPPVRPALAMARMSAETAGPPTPVSEGSIEIRATVTLTVAIAE